MAHSDHTRERVPLLAPGTRSSGTRHDGPMADVGASALRWSPGRARRPPRHRASSERGAPARLSSARCPSYPRSRRSAASSRRASRAARSTALEIRDPRWCAPLRRPRCPMPSPGGASRARPPRQVPRLELEGEVHLIMHLRMTGTLLWTPRRAALPARRVHARATGTSCASATRAASGPASSRSATPRATRSSPRGSASSRSARIHGRAPARARARAARRSRRSCSTSARSRASGTSTPTRRCSARRSTRCGRSGAHRAAVRGAGRCGARRADRGPRRRRGDDRRLPSPGRRAGRLPARVPRAPARRRGLPALRRRVAKFVAAGRGTYVCERCQPRPRGAASGGARASSAERVRRWSAMISSRKPPSGRRRR